MHSNPELLFLLFLLQPKSEQVAIGNLNHKKLQYNKKNDCLLRARVKWSSKHLQNNKQADY